MFTNQHRYFIQHLLQTSYISVDQALKFFKKISDEQHQTMDSLKQLIQTINEKLSKQELRIVITKCDLTDKENVTLINTGSDNLTRQLKTFTPSELVYFQTIVKEIITTEGQKIPYGICINLSRMEPTSLKADDAEFVLEKWLSMGYFIKIGQDIHLGSRSIAEFIPLFHQYYKDYIKICYLCSDLVFSGQTCNDCKEEFHRLCMKKFLVKHKNCPNCMNRSQSKNQPSTSRKRQRLD